MPELLNRSPDELLNAMAASFGATWPNPWWPSGNSAYDDCAACVSFYLFGLNSFGNPFYTYVSQIQSWGRDRGVWHDGWEGVQRGDVVAFDWDGDGDPDHTEIVVAVYPRSGTVTTRGTNSGPGDDLHDSKRSVGYILSYIRPPYLQGDEFDMASLDDLNRIVNDAVSRAIAATASATSARTSAIRREGRGRLYYCATPPPGLPHFICIFWDRTTNNILYANVDADGGETQARHWNELYFQTADTVEQAKANAIDAERFQKLIDFALGRDSSFTNQLATPS